MHDELVKQLRNCATQAAPCNTCGLIEDSSCSDTLMKQAADAIEELNRRIDRAIEIYNRNVEKSAMYEALVGISPEPPKEWET